MWSNKNFGVVVKAIIKNHKDEFLLLKKSTHPDSEPTVWDLPGGLINFGENPYSALHNHIRHLTGLEVDVLKPSNVWSHMKNDTHLVGITFFCKAEDNNVVMNHDTHTHSWANSQKILKSKLPKWIKDEIRATQQDDSTLDIQMPKKISNIDKLYKRFGF
jgi:ADP-ribose pyrophosphatase YjhB (NUDIX family)